MLHSIKRGMIGTSFIAVTFICNSVAAGDDSDLRGRFLAEAPAGWEEMRKTNNNFAGSYNEEILNLSPDGTGVTSDP